MESNHQENQSRKAPLAIEFYGYNGIVYLSLNVTCLQWRYQHKLTYVYLFLITCIHFESYIIKEFIGALSGL